MKYEVQSKMKPALNTGFYTQLIFIVDIACDN